MDAWFNALLDWIAAHPIAAGIAVFAIALSDSLIILGTIVPALPLLFAVGMLIGLGQISGPYAVVSAALGAFVGDAVSFWAGRRWGAQMRRMWPFSRFPQLLIRGEVMFRRNAVKSIFVARFVGAIRPFVPAVAGMLHMPLQRYAPASALAAFAWALIFLAPGWMLGQAYDAVAAVAGRLSIVVGLLLLALAVVWAVVLYSYRWFASHADSLSARLLAWSHAHPVLGRYSIGLLDPKRRESPSLVVLGVLLIALGCVCFFFIGTVINHGEPLSIDLAVYSLMHGLRNPLADGPLSAIASLGDAQVLIPATAAVMAYLVWRRRWLAIGHWVAAIGFGLALTALLGAVVDIPKPPMVVRGFGFPSITVTFTTITFGFFAVMVARGMPGRDRIWPYMVAGVVVVLVGFARIYLGAHWLSDVVGGSLLGGMWVLVLGIAYRSRAYRPLWIKPLAWMFYGVFIAAALWHMPRAAGPLLARFDGPAASVDIGREVWWAGDWRTLPGRRNEFDDEHRWPLDVQVAGPLAPLQTRLISAGWRVQPQAGWQAALSLLDNDEQGADQPVLPATVDTRAEALLMLREGAQPGQRYALRLWATPIRLQPGDEPVWIGSAQTLEHRKVFGLIGLWRPLAEAQPPLQALIDASNGLDQDIAPHPETGLPVLRLRTLPTP
jgi:membrane protein DedA with SNARE-associated domain/membrane-associated phospholipid phosphatase